MFANRLRQLGCDEVKFSGEQFSAYLDQMNADQQSSRGTKRRIEG